jgi:hypothetical protein
MRLILVCGPWSSGTTVVSAMLSQLGARGLPPYLRTNDPLTENSFESRDFRAMIGELIDENTLTMRVDWPAAQARITAFREQLEATIGDVGEPLFLKYPLSVALIPEICAAFSARLVCVVRPMAAIEATRVRRGWAPQFGAAGARVLYPRMFEALIETRTPMLMLRYADVLEQPVAQAEQLARFCGLSADSGRIAAAASVVRSRGTS